MTGPDDLDDDDWSDEWDDEISTRYHDRLEAGQSSAPDPLRVSGCPHCCGVVIDGLCQCCLRVVPAMARAASPPSER